MVVKFEYLFKPQSSALSSPVASFFFPHSVSTAVSNHSPSFVSEGITICSNYVYRNASIFL